MNIEENSSRKCITFTDSSGGPSHNKKKASRLRTVRLPAELDEAIEAQASDSASTWSEALRDLLALALVSARFRPGANLAKLTARLQARLIPGDEAQGP